MVGIEVWSAITNLGSKMLLDRARPDSGLVEEALSFDATAVHHISNEKLRQYLIVLGQYLITLQFTENQFEAVYNAWNKSLDLLMYKALREGVNKEGEVFKPEGKTLSEKKAWVLSEDVQAANFYNELAQAEAKKTIVRGMSRPVEQYINTLKKELDARSTEEKVVRESNG